MGSERPFALNPKAGPSRAVLSDDRRGPTRRQKSRSYKYCSCFWSSILASSLHTATASPVNAREGNGEQDRVLPLAPAASVNKAEAILRGDSRQKRRSEAYFKPIEQAIRLQIVSSSSSSLFPSSTPDTAASAQYTRATSYSPFSNGKRDRTPYYAVPLIITASIVLFTLIMLVLGGSALFWRKRRRHYKRHRAKKSDEGFGEEEKDMTAEDLALVDEEELVDGETTSDDTSLTNEKTKKKKRITLVRAKVMNRFRNQKSAIIKVSATGDTASLRRRFPRSSTLNSSAEVATTVDQSVSAVTTVDQANNDCAQPSSHAPSRPASPVQTLSSNHTQQSPSLQIVESQNEFLQEVAPSTSVSTPLPPAYQHSRSPLYIGTSTLTPRQMEKQPVRDASPESPQEELDAEDLPTHFESVEEQQAVSAHVATDDKATLQRMYQMASQPVDDTGNLPQVQPRDCDGVAASAPHVIVDEDGFEAGEHEEYLAEPTHDGESAQMYPAPPTAIMHSFSALPTLQAIQPSAPDSNDMGEETALSLAEASAPLADEIYLSEADAIQSTAPVSWLPIYEPNSGHPRMEHGVV